MSALHPNSEKSVAFKNGAMVDLGIKEDEAKALVDYIGKLK